MNKTRKVKPMVCKSPGTLEFIGEKTSKKGKKSQQTKRKKIDRR